MCAENVDIMREAKCSQIGSLPSAVGFLSPRTLHSLNFYGFDPHGNPRLKGLTGRLNLIGNPCYFQRGNKIHIL